MILQTFEALCAVWKMRGYQVNFRKTKGYPSEKAVFLNLETTFLIKKQDQIFPDLDRIENQE